MGTTVNLRWKKYKSGTESAYLDIWHNGTRRKEFIDIKIKKGEKKKDKRDTAKKIRTKRHNAIIEKKHDIFSEDRLEVDFIKYYQIFLKNYKKAGIRKYRYAYEKFLLFLKREGNIKKIIATENNLVQPYSTISEKERFKFKDLTKDICQGYKDYLYGPSGLKGETPYDYYKRFKAVVNKAYDERYLIENVSSKVKLQKPKSTLEKQILTKEELQILAKTKCGNPEVKRAFLFACFTGLGEKEIKSLVWKEVADGRLNTKRAKNGEKLSSKLPATAIKLLGPVGLKNKKIFTLPSDVAISKNIKNWLKRAKIDKHITFYCGRHSFAVMNLKAGVNLKTISKLMGHTTTVPTNKYLNYLDEEKDKAMDSLPELDI